MSIIGITLKQLNFKEIFKETKIINIVVVNWYQSETEYSFKEYNKKLEQFIQENGNRMVHDFMCNYDRTYIQLRNVKGEKVK